MSFLGTLISISFAVFEKLTAPLFFHPFGAFEVRSLAWPLVWNWSTM